jgi:hypothetical protein
MLFQREPIRTPIRGASTVKVEHSGASNTFTARSERLNRKLDRSDGKLCVPRLSWNNAKVAKLADAPDLRIPKSSISKRSFSFQKTRDLREENGIFLEMIRLHDRKLETSSF